MGRKGNNYYKKMHGKIFLECLEENKLLKICKFTQLFLPYIYMFGGFFQLLFKPYAINSVQQCELDRICCRRLFSLMMDVREYDCK